MAVQDAAMGEYGAVGSTVGGGGGGAHASQGNVFADMTNSVAGSLGDFADWVLRLPPLMLLVIVFVVVFGGLLVFRRV
jgi:hypothetical protein